MQHEILLPQVELTMENVKVVAWTVGVGDEVAADQTILEVETQKGVVEVPAPLGGVVRQLCVQEGDELGEKALICILTDTADEAFEEPRVETAAVAEVESASPEVSRETAVSDPAPADGAIRAAPAARRRARELGVDLAQVRGTGPGGRITVEDVEKVSG